MGGSVGGSVGGSTPGGPPPPGGDWGGMTIPPGVSGVISIGPIEVTGARAIGASPILGGGGTNASTSSFGGVGFVTLPKARCFGAGAARCFVLVSSALVRSPGDLSVIIAKKLFAAATPGKEFSTPK